MTRRSFTVIDIVEILVHWSAGRKKAEVARSLGVDRGTVAKYTAKAKSEGYVPGGEQLPVQRWAELAHAWFPELVDPRQRSLTHATIDAHRSEIAQMLKTNTATTVHQRLRDEHGLKVGISSFRRYIWRELPEDNLRNIATPPRPEVPAGEEAQVDYGYLGTWFDPLAERAAGVGVRDRAGVQPLHVRAAGAQHGPAGLDGRATSRPSRSSVAHRVGL